MAQCLIPNCTNNAEHNIGIRCRRRNTTAIWSPNANAYLCSQHAQQGYIVDIVLTPIQQRTVTTNVSCGNNTISRTTPIVHNP